jgi:hypothetical protein
MSADRSMGAGIVGRSIPGNAGTAAVRGTGPGGAMLDDISVPSRLAEPDEGISADELILAARNHGLPL